MDIDILINYVRDRRKKDIGGEARDWFVVEKVIKWIEEVRDMKELEIQIQTAETDGMIPKIIPKPKLSFDQLIQRASQDPHMNPEGRARLAFALETRKRKPVRPKV